MKQFFKKVYLKIPFKKNIFSLLKKIWSPPSSIYKHLHFKAPFEVSINENEKFKMHHFGFEIENEVFWKGVTNGWEKQSLSLWVPLSRKSKVIFDIGANTGIYSLISKSVNPKAMVFAFEPVKRVYEKLLMNNELNNFDIIGIEKAASVFTGTAKIYDQNTEHTYSVAVNKDLTNEGTKTVISTIDTISLKEFIEDHKIDRIDLMKIDVETHEPEVLEGMGDFLKIYQPTLLIEILTDEVGQRVQNLIQEIDYLYFNIDENNGIRQVPTITHSDYYNFLICKKEVASDLGLLN